MDRYKNYSTEVLGADFSYSINEGGEFLIVMERLGTLFNPLSWILVRAVEQYSFEQQEV